MSERSSEIAAAARDLIIESGGSLPTVRQIASRSYLSPAAIYVHFPNFDAIVERVRLTAAEALLATLRLESPTSIRAALPAISAWLVDNLELVAGCTSGSTGPSAECVDLINRGLVECGEGPFDPTLIHLGIRFMSLIPMLTKDLGYGAVEVEEYLLSLAAPLEVLISASPVVVVPA